MAKIAERITSRTVLIVGGVAVVPIVIAGVVLAAMLPNLSKGNQAVAIATAMGAFGTLALAAATFLSILQSNATLTLREKEVKKPLVVDELSNIVEPAIRTLQSNLNPDGNFYGGCRYEWNYIDQGDLARTPRRPYPIISDDAAGLARIADEQPDILEQIQHHNEKIAEAANTAEKLADRLEPQIKEALVNFGRGPEESSDVRVITGSVLKEVDEFGEVSELYEFWEEHGEQLINSAEELSEPSLDDLHQQEQEYRNSAEMTLKQLQERKLALKREYGVAEEEIAVEDRLL